LQASPIAVFAMNPQGIVILWNKAAEQIFGWSEEEAVGKVIPIVPEGKQEEFRALCERLLNGESLMGIELERQRKDGSTINVSITAAPLYDSMGRIDGIMSLASDISLHKKMEEELLQKEKLESVGILAGGIAHDFNNLLQAIVGNISLARLFLSEHSLEKIPAVLLQAEEASDAAKELSFRLLTFSKGGDPVRKLTSVESILKKSVSLSLSGSRVIMDFAPPKNLYPVEIDEGQMTQVFNNVLINAKEAMLQGGVISIRARNVSISENGDIPSKKGEYVEVSIKDSGIGIPQGNLSKIFDPYFSTKGLRSQKGSGLGLSICLSIVKKHEGYMKVESEEGIGTTFHIYIPAVTDTSYDQSKDEADYQETSKTRVLFMDDDERLKTVVQSIIEYLGYEFVYAKNGEEAIEIFKRAKESGETFATVILDLTVQGGMGGDQAVKRLLEIDPEVKAIISSGYVDAPIMKNFREYGFVDAIAKPYRIEELEELFDRHHKG